MDNLIIIFNWMDIKNPNAGGQEKYCFEIGKRLARNGMKVYWISSKFRNCMTREVIENIEIIRTGNIYTVFLTAFFKYLKYRKNAYLVISINSIPFFLPFTRNKRIVILHHRIDLKVMLEKIGLLGYLSFFLQEHFNPIIYHNDHVITNSPSSKFDFESIGYKEISIVKLGIDLPKNYNFKKKNICVSPGPVKPWKHHDLVLRAFSCISSSWELSIFGSFESREYEKKLYAICRDLKISDRVHFFGRIGDDEVKALYSQASICIIGSEKEGWGLVSMEAESYGCPVVAFSVPGIKDSVINGETGILVKFGDVSSMANALYSLANNREKLLEMGKNGIMRSQEYSWEECYNEFMQEFKKIF